MLNKQQKAKVPSKSYMYIEGNKPAAEVGSENGAKPSEQDQEDAVESEETEAETTDADSIDDVNVVEGQEKTVSNNEDSSEDVP